MTLPVSIATRNNDNGSYGSRNGNCGSESGSAASGSCGRQSATSHLLIGTPPLQPLLLNINGGVITSSVSKMSHPLGYRALGQGWGEAQGWEDN